MTNKKILSVLLLNFLLVACQQPAEPPPPPRPALVTIVGAAATDKAMVLVGEVKSRYESNTSFRVNGKIIERKVEVGSFVKKGQIIARIDATDANLSAQAAIADVRSAEANYALAKAEVERQRQLVEKKFISQSALDIREAELKTSAARVQQAKAQSAASGNQTRYAALIADRDGVITQIKAEPGQVVQAGEMVAQIVDTKHIEVLIAVPESRMVALKAGDKVAIKLWAKIGAEDEKTYAGTVREIAPAANSSTRAFDVRVTIDDADEAVRLGMTAGVHFMDEQTADIEVPLSAVTQINGQNTLWVIDKNGIAHPRAINIGQFTEDGVNVISGLQKGEMIAIAGIHTLVKGQKVQPKLAQKAGL